MFFHILPSQAGDCEPGRNFWTPTTLLHILVRASSTVTKITGMQQACEGQDLHQVT